MVDVDATGVWNLMQLEFGMCFDVYIPKLRIILISCSIALKLLSQNLFNVASRQWELARALEQIFRQSEHDALILGMDQDTLLVWSWNIYFSHLYLPHYFMAFSENHGNTPKFQGWSSHESPHRPPMNSVRNYPPLSSQMGRLQILLVPAENSMDDWEMNKTSLWFMIN